jgi:RNA polymerase sigma-70 factor, ECF subfamily
MRAARSAEKQADARSRGKDPKSAAPTRSKTTTTPKAPPADPQARMRRFVEDHLRLVTRTLRRAGVPPSDLDDEVQRTFVVAARRLDDVHLGAERSFVFQVALNVAAHSRRKMARRRELLLPEGPERIEAMATPEYFAGRKQLQKRIDAIIASIPEPLRSTFMAFAFDEMDMNEIATHFHIPRGTVASRLRRARAFLREHVAMIELASDSGISGAGRMGQPELMRSEELSAIVRALLGAGTSAPVSAATRAKTLAALGLPARGRR